MTSLPWIKAPATATVRRCGNDLTGILELPVYGGIRVAETDLITELLHSEESVFVRAAKIADVVSKAEDISITEAYDLVEKAVTGQQLEAPAEPIRLRHAALIEQLGRIYITSARRTAQATVTALINIRLDRPSWGLADTRTLLYPLFDDIWALAEDERKSEPSAAPTAAPDDEQLGKPPEASGAPAKSTGRRSRGI